MPGSFVPLPARIAVEIPVNLKSILEGKTSDVALKADDILFIPTNVAKGVIIEYHADGNFDCHIRSDLRRYSY